MLDSVSLTSIQKEKLKRKLERNFLYFVMYAFLKMNKKQFIVNHHHVKIASFMEDVWLMKIINGIINIPPRYSKTLMCVIMFVTWCYAKNKKCNFIHLSYSDALVQKNSTEIKDMIKSAWFQELWPMQFDNKTDSKAMWRIVDGGGFYATSTGGQITGHGAGSVDHTQERNVYDWLEEFDLLLEDIEPDNGMFGGGIVIDDPQKPKDAKSDLVRNETNERLNNTIISRKNSPEKTALIIVMQRLHEDDMTGFCLDNNTSEKFNHLCMQALDDDGNALWPAKHSKEKLLTMKKTDPYTFSGQYQQEPSPIEGEMFKKSNWQYVDAEPVDGIECRSYDLAATEAKSAAKTASVRIKKVDGKYYICHAESENFKPDDVDKLILNNAKADGKTCLISYPQDPGQAGKSQANYLGKMLAGFWFTHSIESGSKEERARAPSSQQAIGNVYLVKGDWNKSFVEEHAKFPNGKFKDQVDAFSRGFHEINELGAQEFDDTEDSEYNDNNINSDEVENEYF